MATVFGQKIIKGSTQTYLDFENANQEIKARTLVPYFPN